MDDLKSTETEEHSSPKQHKKGTAMKMFRKIAKLKGKSKKAKAKKRRSRSLPRTSDEIDQACAATASKIVAMSLSSAEQQLSPVPEKTHKEHQERGRTKTRQDGGGLLSRFTGGTRSVSPISKNKKQKKGKSLKKLHKHLREHHQQVLEKLHAHYNHHNKKKKQMSEEEFLKLMERKGLEDFESVELTPEQEELFLKVQGFMRHEVEGSSSSDDDDQFNIYNVDDYYYGGANYDEEDDYEDYQGNYDEDEEDQDGYGALDGYY